MQLTKIFLGLVSTTMVSSLTIPFSRALDSLDPRAEIQPVSDVNKFPELLLRIENIARSDSQGHGGSDIDMRVRFTQSFVKNFNAALSAEYQAYAIVVCNVGYEFEGTPLWKSENLVYPQDEPFSSNVDYDVLVFNKGKFTRKGNGGFQNWAYLKPRGACTAVDNVIDCP